MAYIVKISGFSIYHISQDDSTLCGFNLSGNQYELCNRLPEDRGFVCNKCERIKRDESLQFDLDQKKKIRSLQDILFAFGNMHVLFNMSCETQRVLFGLEEALQFSTPAYLADSLENAKAEFRPSANKNKIEVTFPVPVEDEVSKLEVEFAKIEYFSSVIKRRVFESLKERKN